VTGGKARPTNRNMGDYLAALQKLDAGDPKVRSALKDLKDLHRNPLIHPEQFLESVDEAIALMNGIHAVMVHMLREISEELIPKSVVPANPLAAAVLEVNPKTALQGDKSV
jgi:hypothetical protein